MHFCLHAQPSRWMLVTSQFLHAYNIDKYQIWVQLNLYLYLIAIKYKIWVIVIVFLVWKLFVFVIKYFPNVFKYLKLLQILLLQ